MPDEPGFLHPTARHSLGGGLTATEKMIVVILTILVIFGIAHIVEFFIDFTIPVPPLETETETGEEYRKIWIEGMPCIWIHQGSGNNQRAGLSCNWGMWNGE